MVLDKTGLTGKYDLKLQWSAEDDSTPPSSQEPGWPSLLTAVQEQLGLKLQPTKIPIETILIDHIELPSEN